MRQRDRRGAAAEDPRAGLRRRLGDALDAKGWEQKDLAEKLRLSESAVSKWFVRGRLDSWLRLAQVCRIAEVSADWLLGLDEAKAPPAPALDSETVASALGHLDEARRLLAAAQEAEEVARLARAGAERTAPKDKTRAKRGVG